MTSAERRAALEEFDRALGNYPGAAEYLDQQRAIERRNAALKHGSPAPWPRFSTSAASRSRAQRSSI